MSWTAPAALRSREGALAIGLAGFAALRVLVFSLAFPFFTNVDEYRHFDVVLKYARGYWPTPGPDRYEPETAWYVGRFGSLEYHRDPARPSRAELPPPTWRLPDREAQARIAAQEAYLRPRHSLEADQPPVYYAAAGAWLVLGRELGLNGGPLLYWVRSLSALGAFVTVLAAWGLLREPYAGSPLVRLGAPALLAVLPQDALYYVTGDALSPLLGGMAFLLTLRLARHPGLGSRDYALAGLATAAAFLCKYPNAALMLSGAVCCGAVWRSPPVASGAGRRWGLFWGVALLPPLLWLGRNAWVGGDASGTAFKVETLGWGRKPLAEVLDHPLFTPAGVVEFLGGLVPRFWRGELVWYRYELAWPPADAVYLASTLLLLTLAAAALTRRARAPAMRLAEASALTATLAGVGILALLSLIFVFHDTSVPSAQHPYFVQGRLISGVLVPFALLWVRGLEVATARLPAAVGWALLAALAALALGSEVWLAAPVFASPYNAFHLP
jgi:hypothetical protein